MDPKDLKRILDSIKESDVNEFSLETPDYKLHVKRGAEVVHVAAPPQVTMAATAPAPVVVPVTAPAPLAAPVETPAPAPVAAPVATPASSGTTIKAPIVGTFYRSSSPDAAAFVQVGDRVEAGKILCIIEAMKLMNEIEAEVAGTIKEILVQNASPVEYGQPLFIIE
jgi:acetyl-CoA carboxylase biotin carboxyl carrier protein